MNHSNTKQLLLSSQFWVLNKTLVEKLGLECAFFISNLAEAEKMMADKNGWVYQTIDMVEGMTTLSRRKQDVCIRTLIGLGVIEQENRGMPMKRYFKINYDKLSTTLFGESVQPSMCKTDKLVCANSTTNKESSYKESSYKENNKDIDHFFEEVWKLYPKKVGKGKISLTKKKEIYRLGEEFKKCIDRYIDHVRRERAKGFKDLQHQNGSTFFNSGYVDYTDENYSGGSEGNRKDREHDREDPYSGLGISL